MSATDTKPRAPRVFVFMGLALAWALYVAHLYLSESSWPWQRGSRPGGQGYAESPIPPDRGGITVFRGIVFLAAGQAGFLITSPRELDMSAFIYCVECGTKYQRSDDVCPNCGGRNLKKLDERLPPIQSWFAMVGATLVLVGVAVFCGGAIMIDAHSRSQSKPGLGDFFLGGAVYEAIVMEQQLILLTGLIELIALVFCTIWLYQAWRIAMHEDRESAPGWMVGLMFVPFFNFYWIFRAIPGLSLALQRKLKSLNPTSPNPAGWIVGLIACILVLIPYFQPIAVCMLLVWMLIANKAVHRLVRLHEQMQAKT
jgi:uncharacterized membrane protein YphA (DoxX/SURF4 family)